MNQNCLKETRDDETKNSKYQTEKHDQEIIIKWLKTDDEYYKKNKSLKKKKVLQIITKILLGSGYAIGTSTRSVLNPSIGIVPTSPSALKTPIAIIITNESISKLKIRYTKIRDWINVITFSI